MKKVSKILLNTISALLVFLIVIPIFLSLILSVNSVQNFIIKKAGEYASEKMGSQVSIGHIKIHNLYSVEIEDIYVQDPIRRDTLTYVSRAIVEMGGYGISSGKVIFNSVKVRNGEFNLNQYPDSITNVKYIIDYLRGDTPPNPDSNTKLLFRDISLDSMAFRYRQNTKKETSHGINFSDMSLQNISGKVKYFEISGSVMTIGVDHLSLVENGELEVKKLSADKIYLSPDKMYYKGVLIKLDNSEIDVNMFQMTYSDWNMGDFLNKVPITADIERAHVDFEDVAKFTGQKRDWKTVVDLSVTFDGTISDFKGYIKYIKSGQTTIVDTKYGIKGIPYPKKMYFSFDTEKIRTNLKDIYILANDFAIKETLSFAKNATYKNDILLTGKFDGLISDFKASASIKPANSTGEGVLSVSYRKKGNNTNISGTVNTRNLNIGNIIQNNNIGVLTSDIKVNGMFSSKSNDIKSTIRIDDVSFSRGRFNNIDISTHIDDNSIMVDVVSQDTNINLKANGYIDFSEESPTYNAFIEINEANLFALNILKNDSISHASSHIILNGIGLSMDNITLQARLNNLNLHNSKDTISNIKNIDIKFNNSPKIKSISINSDFMDVTLKGVASLDKIKEYIEESISTYLPIFFKKSSVSDRSELSSNFDVNEYYIAQVNLKKQTPLLNFIVPDLFVATGSKVLFMFNPYRKTYSITANVPFISYKKNMASEISLNSMNNSTDSMQLYLSVSEILYDNLYIPQLSIINSLSNDNLEFTAGFHNDKNDSQLLLRSKGELLRDTITGSVELKTTILPSYYRFEKKQWDILSGDIDIYRRNNDLAVKIDTLNVVSAGESLYVNGVLSNNKLDSLSVTLQNFNIKPLSILLKNIGFSISGQVGGQMNVIGALSNENRRIEGEISINNLLFNETPLDNSRIIAKWNGTKEINEIQMFSKKTEAELASGHFSWINKTFGFDLKFDSISPRIVAPFLGGIAGGISGSCDAKINISNDNKQNKTLLNGNVKVNDFSAIIDYTKVRYHAVGNMNITDNLFDMKGATIKDSLGGNGGLDLMLNPNSEKGFEFNIRITPNEMLAINTTQRDNPVFYGNVFATGEVIIKNSLNGIDFTANAKTAKRSKFYLPLSYNSNISTAEFIKFVTHSTHDSTKTLLWDTYKSRNTTKNESSGMNMRLDISVLDNTEIEIVIDPISGSTINSIGHGDMMIHIVPNDNIFSINGEYMISKGTYRFIMPNFNLVDKLFTIKEGGWIRFIGNPLDATLNVDAIYKVKASISPLTQNSTDLGGFGKRVNVDCIMTIKDRLMKPNIVLGVDVLNTDPESAAFVKNALKTPEEISNQFIFLLLTNSFMATESNSNNASAGLMTGVVTGVEFLTNRIKDIISTDKFDFSLNYLPKSGVTSDEFTMGISTPLYKDRLLLDVQGNYNFMNNKASITSQNMTKLSGEFYLTWVLSESGNLRLKGFSRTIDTFDENQGLQESGVGIYYKEEFNSLEDLKQKYRQYREDRKKRQEKRKEKKEKKREAKKAKEAIIEKKAISTINNENTINIE